MIKQYKKRPVVISAMQFNGGWSGDGSAICEWIGASGTWTSRACGDGLLHIRTLEGDMTASPGDYIIKGVKGEFYPCKPDIFEATYDVLELDDASPSVPS